MEAEIIPSSLVTGMPPGGKLGELPKSLIVAVETRPDGTKRTPQMIAWYFRSLDTGDATRAAIEVGYAESNAPWQSWRLKQEFGPLIAMGLMHRRGMLDALALRTMEKAMVAYGQDYIWINHSTNEERDTEPPKGWRTEKRHIVALTKKGEARQVEVPTWELVNRLDNSPQAAAIAVKAAAEILDRSAMPKGLALQGKEVAPREDDSIDSKSAIRLIKDLIEEVGPDFVRALPFVQNHRGLRVFMDSEWPLEEVNPVTGEVP